MDLITIQKLGIATGLGLLVGFQREWTAPHVAGLRTFTLITVLGAVIGLFVDDAGGWLISTGLIVVAAMNIVGSLVKDVFLRDSLHSPAHDVCKSCTFYLLPMQ